MYQDSRKLERENEHVVGRIHCSCDAVHSHVHSHEVVSNGCNII